MRQGAISNDCEFMSMSSLSDSSMTLLALQPFLGTSVVRLPTTSSSDLIWERSSLISLITFTCCSGRTFSYQWRAWSSSCSYAISPTRFSGSSRSTATTCGCWTTWRRTTRWRQTMISNWTPITVLYAGKRWTQHASFLALISFTIRAYSHGSSRTRHVRRVASR